MEKLLNSNKNKTIAAGTALTLLFAVIILSISLKLTQQKQDLNRLANNEPVYPIQVKVVNQKDTGFSVSWATKEAVNGFIVYGLDRDKVIESGYQSPKIADQRGEGLYYTHLVTIDNLEAGKNYYFKIVDPNFQYLQTLDNEWRESGIAGSILLPVNPGRNPGSFSLETGANNGCNGLPQALNYCFRPNPVWGQLYQQDNQTAKDALVFIDIPGKSNIIATKTNENGRWAMDLSNFWEKDWADYLGYNPGTDLIRVSALAKDSMISTYRQISGVVTGQEQRTSPINLTLENAPFVVRANTPTPTPTTLATPTPTIRSQATTNPNKVELIINFRFKNTAKLASKVELKNKLGRRQIKSVTFSHQTGDQYKGVFDFISPDEYEIQVKPDGYLSSSLGKFTLHTGTNYLSSNNSTWLAGDVNNDGSVNILDISLLLSKYLVSQKSSTSIDLNADGIINMIDLSLLLGNYHANI